MSQLAPGTIFARDYRIVRALAEGGMGAVYVAEQLSTGRERALKVLRPELVDNARMRDGFAQEARVSARVESDHVVEVVGAGIDEATGSPWLAMELLRGDDLATLVARRGPLPHDELVTLFDQLGDALAKAHRVGLVHRDLKPENLFVATSRIKGVPFVVKVLDFGISRLIASDRTAATATQALGSPLWLAPEQTESGSLIRPATDVWALGLLAFWALTGKTYWLAAHEPTFNLAALLMEVAVLPLPPAEARAAVLGVADRLPAGFGPWFGRCVTRPQGERFADAGEAIQALLAVLTASSTPTVSGPPVARTEAFVGPVVRPTEVIPVVVPPPVGPPVPPPVVDPGPPPRPTRPPEAPPSPYANYLVPGLLGLATAIALTAWSMGPRPQPAAPAVEVAALTPPVPTAPVEDPLSNGAPVMARHTTPTSPDPRGGRFALSDATMGLGVGGRRLMASIETSQGVLRCTLLDAQAPQTVANFVGLARGVREFWDPVTARWARRPFYDGSIFHRVIPDFMIQGGDLLRSGAGGTGYEFADENVHGHNVGGQLCMANRGPHTNGGQFFVTETAVPRLDGSYSIFGQCGPLEVVHRIARVDRDGRDRPRVPVYIYRVRITRVY